MGSFYIAFVILTAVNGPISYASFALAQREHRILSGLVLTVSALIAIAGMFILYHIIDVNQFSRPAL